MSEIIKIDAVGVQCPMPVVMTKKEFDKIQEGVVEVTADNFTCVQNLEKFAKSNSFEFSYEQKEEDRWLVTIEKKLGQGLAKEDVNTGLVNDKFTIAIGTDHYGQGAEELGKILMKSFIYTVSETEPYPTSMVFFNSGVKLTTEGSPVLEDLKKLAENGVQIISCGTCLDFYEIKDKLQVGEISNMYTIYETIRDAGRNMVIG